MSTTDFIVRINGKDVKDKAAARMASIAPVEVSTTAAHAYAVGKYFWLNDILYVATAAISVGGTITVGTNCAAAIIGDDVSGKLEANQGAANSGKVMTVNSAGGVVPAEVIGADLTVTEASLGGDDYNLQFNVINNGLANDVVELAGDVSDLQTAVEELEAGSLSALGASNGQVPVADGAGAWAWGNVSGGGGSSGSGMMVVNVTYEEDNDSFSADKTYAEIVEHINVGGYVVLRYIDYTPLKDEPQDIWYDLCYWQRDASTGTLKFLSIYVYSSSGVTQDAFVISHDNTVTRVSSGYPI